MANAVCALCMVAPNNKNAASAVPVEGDRCGYGDVYTAVIRSGAVLFYVVCTP